MDKARNNRKYYSWMAFLIAFSLCVALGITIALVRPVNAAPSADTTAQQVSYAGSDSCKQCHEGIVDAWQNTRHAQAFSSPIFQRDWGELGQKTNCLACHTTGFDPQTGSYAQEGISCEACHGPFQPNHPGQFMSITPDAELCATCHKNTTDEWRASKHAQAGVQCQACHNPHSQTPKADTITALCSNCHKERGDSFTHGTHASSGLECSNCHMYTPPRTEDPIEGLVPTGHTFSVGSDACIGCHQDTVHTRDEIVKLTGEVSQINTVDMATLQQQVSIQEETIKNLETKGTVRLYTGLAQGAIVGLITGGVAAWVVSRRIHIIEED